MGSFEKNHFSFLQIRACHLENRSVLSKLVKFIFDDSKKTFKRATLASNFIYFLLE